MEDHNQDIDQYFKEQLGGYTEQPAPDVWAALEQRLDEKPRKRRVLWIWFALLFTAAAGGAAYYTQFAANETINETVPQKPVHASLPGTKKSLAVTTPTPKPLNEPAPPKEQSTNHKPQKTKSPVPPVFVNSRSLSPVEPELEVNTDISETTMVKTEPVTAIDPAPMQIETPEPEQDLLQLLPTAGTNDKHAAPINEETFQALAPTTGPKKEIIEAAPAEAPVANQPAQASGTISKTSGATEITQTTPAETEKSTPVNIAVDTPRVGKERIRRFSAGLKTGYEFGTRPYHANSFVLSPYLQYNFSKRFGLLLQPALKYSHSPAADLSYGSYTKTTDSLKEVIFTGTPNSGSGNPTGNDQDMAYQKTYDSVFIRNELKDVRYWNLDLPLMLSYKVHKNFSIYAGPAFHFTRVPKVVSNKQVYSGLILNDTLKMDHKPMSADFDTLSIEKVFPQKGFDISQYNASAFDNPEINPFKLGVTFGLSYSFRQRFHFDILYRQSLSKMDYIQNAKLREILRQPYIRVTLGFDLLK